MFERLAKTAAVRRKVRVGLSASALALAVGILASPAQAAFTAAPCDGSAVTGRGASFQAQAHIGWETVFRGFDFCDTTAPDITYEPQGSGAGRRALGERTGSNTQGNRDAIVRFGASDEAPTPTGRDQMEQGSTVNADGSGGDLTDADDGKLHILPVATGSTAMIVNYPDNCEIPAAHSTDAAGVNRFKRPNVEIEKAWAADSSVDTWGELLPGITATPGNIAGKTDLDCASQSIRRVARLDSSGTTFSYKQWLKEVNPARTWEEPALGNTAWPNNVVATPSEVLRGTGNGNGPLADRVNTTDGSIGYSDLATARSKGFDKTVNTDGTFWIPLQNSVGGYEEPSADPDSYKNGIKGSNCSQVVYDNIPGGLTPTLGDWSTVSGVNPVSGFAVCTLTYLLIWDDSAVVFGATGAEELKARTVKDYLNAILSSAGQSALVLNDYFALPANATQNLLTASRTAASTVDWNKAAAGGTVDPPPADMTPPPTTPPATTLPLPVVTQDPPAVVLPTLKLAGSTLKAKNGVATITINVNLPGSVAISGKGINAVKVKATKAGPTKLKLKLSSKLAKQLAKKRKLRLKLKVVFTPSSGAPTSRNVTINIKR